MQFIMDSLQASGILNLRIIEDAEDATDMSSDSIALLGVLGDKSGRLLEVLGDKYGGLFSSIDLADCKVIGVVGGIAVFLFTYTQN